MYNQDGSYVDLKTYKENAKKYFDVGIGDDTKKARETLFQDTTSAFGVEPTTSLVEMMAYLRHEDNVAAPIIVHCAGPMFMLHELAKHDDLKKRVSRIGAMFLAHDGEANLLGRNFNEGVCPEMTENLWGSDGQNIHQSFPNAELLCVTTETCKSEGMTFTP